MLFAYTFSMGKRIAAIIGIALLVGMYMATLILAILNNDLTQRFFTASIICTVVIPVLIWVYQWIYKTVNKDAEDARTKNYIKEDDIKRG